MTVLVWGLGSCVVSQRVGDRLALIHPLLFTRFCCLSFGYHLLCQWILMEDLGDQELVVQHIIECASKARIDELILECRLRASEEIPRFGSVVQIVIVV